MKTLFAIKKITGIAIVLMLMLVNPGKSFCQDKQNPPQKPSEKVQALTPAQTATIKTILSKYNASKLTEADAKAIHEKFREAGIHAGPETRDAITAAGFDPEKLRTLDPPKSPDNNGKANPPSNEERMKTVQEKIIKPLALNAAQTETITNAYKDFITAMENLKKTQTNPQQPVEKSKVEPLEKARDEKISKVLTKDQFAKYMELEKASRPQKAPGQEPPKN
ncbi:MAG: hypothetical protein NTX43_07685 [Bacteroidetes bacterium]|nr:hypothetical protein [Bacteroidota bacterium]